jgi:hypothetical protein
MFFFGSKPARDFLFVDVRIFYHTDRTNPRMLTSVDSEVDILALLTK